MSQGGRDLFSTHALSDDGKALLALKVVLSALHGKKSDLAIVTWLSGLVMRMFALIVTCR